MLTGTRAFEGEDVAETLANVINKEPAWERLPAAMPARIRGVLQSALQKFPKQRLGDMQSVRLAMDGAFETAATPASDVRALESMDSHRGDFHYSRDGCGWRVRRVSRHTAR